MHWFIEHLITIEKQADTRQQWKVKHKLTDILFIKLIHIGGNIIEEAKTPAAIPEHLRKLTDNERQESITYKNGFTAKIIG